MRHVFVAGRHYVGPKKKAPDAKDEKAGAKDEKKGDAAATKPGAPAGEGALDLTGSWTLESKGGRAFKSTLTLTQKDGKLTARRK